MNRFTSGFSRAKINLPITRESRGHDLIIGFDLLVNLAAHFGEVRMGYWTLRHAFLQEALGFFPDSLIEILHLARRTARDQHFLPERSLLVSRQSRRPTLKQE